MKTKWNSIKFILSPKEFKSLFNDLEYYTPITNARVPTDYKATKNTLILDYELYYNKVISGKSWENEDWKLNIHSSITDNLDHIKYEPFQIEEQNIMQKYMRPVIIEPVINISPFTLKINHKKQLSVIYSDSTYNSNIGIEFSYSKNFYRNSKFVPTDQFSTYQLYLELVKRIKSITNKAKIERNNKLEKPNFWISKSCINVINNSIAIKENNLKLI